MKRLWVLVAFGFVLFSSAILSGPSWADSPMTMDEATALSRWVVPFQTRGFVGVQGAERERSMTVTPGNQFLCLLKEHARRYFRLQNPSLTDSQKEKVVHLLVRTRDRLIEKDALDLSLIQRFESQVITPSVDVAALDRLNERIGAIEGAEGGIFLDAMKSLQGILSSPQRKALIEKNLEIPSMRVDLSSAVFFAERILSIRWNVLSGALGSLNDSTRKQYLATYQKERASITRLGIRMTISNRHEGDLLERPLIDFRALSAQYKKAGPDEGAFWGGLVKALGELNPPTVPSRKG